MTQADSYSRNVFVNCPFDSEYDEIFHALIFTVASCGFRVRCALEIDDSAEVRIDKLFRIISLCQFGIHDLSRTSLDSSTGLPRFNMPLELGMFLAARRFGTGRQKRKNCLVLDTEPYRYQAFISDIAGQDIRARGGSERKVISLVRNWLTAATKRKRIPSGSVILKRYVRFQKQLPKACRQFELTVDELTFTDYADMVSVFLEQSA